ncbi:NTP transferase domain-containing protein [Paenibacillus alvei]|uniref:NTP transferase domain-containing protein n=1 Tax=Paenibacillus alvei TaxID=44250 RepID=UPI0013D8E28D|nr:NTP transferase domain-containing protein [Paenibacillus alvei]NEZ45108.1 NTP transferase domain-containing protein [Paenibacillus alvei]
MSFSKTVVINCAGVGSRLGLGITKALIKIADKPLIAWQLEMLEEVEDVRVVVGYQAEQVIEQVLEIRKNVTFIFNHDYLTTGTAASLSLGSRYAQGMVISLDGDLLVHPDDFRSFLNSNEEGIGYCQPTTEDPVLVTLKQNGSKASVTSFSRDIGEYEWSGLVQVDATKLHSGTRHVYEVLEEFLPLNAVPIRCQEIDTPADYDTAITWVRDNLVNHCKIHGKSN